MIEVGDIVIFTTYNKPAKVLKVDGNHAWIKILKPDASTKGELFVLINQLLYQD